MRKITIFLFSLAIVYSTAASELFKPSNIDGAVKLLTSSPSNVALSFDLGALQREEVEQETGLAEQMVIPEEGFVYIEGQPILPAVTRFIVVPPDKAVELVVDEGETRIVPAALPLLRCAEEQSVNVALSSNHSPRNGIFPPIAAEMSDPAVVRGVRLVKVTTYPVQYDSRNNTYIIRDRIQTDLRFTDGEVVNPVLNPIRSRRSQGFLNFIREIAINGDEVGRDDPERDIEPPFQGHCLVVVHPSCLQYSVPFIEWKRKSGYRLDIVNMGNNAGNAQIVKDSIQARYNSFTRSGLEPFDQILLIGDHQSYEPSVSPAAQWVLASAVGNPSWGGASYPHDDYNFGCLDGNDSYADVGVSRFCAGSEATLNLFVGRLLSYEVTPQMQNTTWFTKGCVYSQKWAGNWHISLHTNVRWGIEVLKRCGMTDVRLGEFTNDGAVTQVGQFLTEQFNEGINLSIGRAENYYWRYGQNMYDGRSGVYPIDIDIAGHHEWTAWWMIRNYDGQGRMMGPCQLVSGYGNMQTLPYSIYWLTIVNGYLLRKLDYGWSRVYGILACERAVPNYGQTYNSMKTDHLFYGDPYLRPWSRVPTLVTAQFNENISPQSRYVEARVLTQQGNNPVADAIVTLYFPGNMPAANNANYGTYNGMWSVTRRADTEGNVAFILPENRQLVANTRMYLTVTGTDIKPFLGERMIAAPQAAVEVGSYRLTERQGNGDDVVNPGETWTLSLVARNVGGQNAVETVMADVTSLSPYLTVTNGDQIWVGDIAAGRETQVDSDISLQFSGDCPDGVSRPKMRPGVQITFYNDDNTWKTGLTFTPHAPHYEFKEVVGGNVLPDTIANIDIQIKNIGSINGASLTAELRSLGMGISVVNGFSTYPAIDAGRFAALNGNRFVVSGNKVVVPGWKNQMMLILRSDAGLVDTTLFTVQVSRPRANAPQGPDKYGYICFDNTDTLWDSAPEYDWLEIDPREQDPYIRGTRIEFTGNSPDNIGEARLVNLPFRTSFYGISYRSITVATNGFICMGDQSRITNFQNWPMDECVGGGLGMLAPLWDDLMLGQNGQCYYAYDRANSQFIVQWSRFRHRNGGNVDLTFQVIIQDADVWITESGDPNITFQYRSIGESQGGGSPWQNDVPYASVGICSPYGDTGINYLYNNTPQITSAPLVNRRAMLFSTSPRYRSGILYGYVTDFWTGMPIEGALVRTKQGFVAFTDNLGYWRIADALAEVRFDIMVHKDGCNDSTYTDTLVHENDSLQLDWQLLHPEFTPSTMRLRYRLDEGRRVELPFSVYNGGNGPLYWRAEKRLLGDANAAPWELRRSYWVGDTTGDDRIEGVVFDGDNFFLSGAAGDQPNTIYVINREGNWINQFVQPGESNYGMKDLEWDGELLWGSGELRVFGFDRDGNVQVQFNGPYNPNQAIAYDSDNGILWICALTNNINAYDRQGQLLDRILNRRGLRIYGLAYWTEDPDGYPLYILNSPAQNILCVHKMNVENSDTLFVRRLPTSGSPGGAYITNEFDVYSWVMISTLNVPPVDGGDRIDIYQLDARKDWIDLSVWADTLNPDETQDFVLTLNSTGLPDTLFEGEIRFTHNAEGLMTNISVSLDVLWVNEPPEPFSLLLPANGDTLRAFPQRGDTVGVPAVRFVWHHSQEWNAADTVRYIFYVQTSGQIALLTTSDTTLTIALDSLRIPLHRFEPITWWVEAISGPHTVRSTEQFTLTLLPNVLDAERNLPVEFGLHLLFPNPFNSQLTIKYGLDRAGPASLKLFDIQGRLTTTLFEGAAQIGNRYAVLDADRLPSGVYYVRLEAQGRVRLAKVALVK